MRLSSNDINVSIIVVQAGVIREGIANRTISQTIIV